jgi:hypothetical protein
VAPPIKERPVSVAASVAQEASDLWKRADGAHGPRGASLERRDDPAQRDAMLNIDEEPARTIGQLCPAALENLQLLEDAIFEAIAGKADVVDELAPLLHTVLSQVGPTRQDVTREHYLRFALAVWRQLNEADVDRDPSRAADAMQVVCLLFGQ